MCRFSKGYKQKKGNDFYLDYFLWMLQVINEHADSFDEEKADGILRPREELFASNPIEGWKMDFSERMHFESCIADYITR